MSEAINPVVICLDDDPMMQKLFGGTLGRKGCEVVMLNGVHALPEALAKLASEGKKPVLLATDDQMPNEGTGAELIARIRSGQLDDKAPGISGITLMLLSGNVVFPPGALSVNKSDPLATKFLAAAVHAAAQIEADNPAAGLQEKAVALVDMLKAQNVDLSPLRTDERVKELLNDFRTATEGYYPESDTEYLRFQKQRNNISTRPAPGSEARLTREAGIMFPDPDVVHIADDATNLRALKARASRSETKNPDL